jgi:hypothetical protein
MAKQVHQAIVSSMPHEQQNELRANLSKLGEACPFDETNHQDCPLFSLREMRPTRRLQWFDALTEDDLGYLAAYHHVCFTIRVESGSAK